jgi:hypothetical protein
MLSLAVMTGGRIVVGRGKRLSTPSGREGLLRNHHLCLSGFRHRFNALAECSADAIFITDFDSAKFVESMQAYQGFGFER